MLEPADKEPLKRSNEDTTIQTVAELSQKFPIQTETDTTEHSPSPLPSWTVQGYKVSTKEYCGNPSELMIVASLAFLAEDSDFRT